jgi:hypothetical protein
VAPCVAGGAMRDEFVRDIRLAEPPDSSDSFENLFQREFLSAALVSNKATIDRLCSLEFEDPLVFRVEMEFGPEGTVLVSAGSDRIGEGNFMEAVVEV